MSEKIAYHDGNDGFNLSNIKINKVQITKTKGELNLMKKILKDDIIKNMIKNRSVLSKVLNKKEGNIFINNNIEDIDLTKLKEYFKNLELIYNRDIKDNSIFSEVEKDIIFEELNFINSIILDINER